MSILEIRLEGMSTRGHDRRNVQIHQYFQRLVDTAASGLVSLRPSPRGAGRRDYAKAVSQQLFPAARRREEEKREQGFNEHGFVLGDGELFRAQNGHEGLGPTQPGRRGQPAGGAARLAGPFSGAVNLTDVRRGQTARASHLHVHRATGMCSWLRHTRSYRSGTHDIRSPNDTRPGRTRGQLRRLPNAVRLDSFCPLRRYDGR